MKLLKRVFGNWWVLSVGAALLLIVGLVLLLPLVVHPLRAPLWRGGLLLIIVVGWCGVAAWRVLSARAASKRLADELTRAQGDTEGVAVAARMGEALASLRALPGAGRDYLYAKPWYVVIGPPGAGKTTALLNSGLRFPHSNALKGAGGTRNLDFWFADDAVLVDTAGRFTTQDSAADRDRDGWESFLRQLRKSRPLQPINGVIVAIGLDTLLSSDLNQLDETAARVRRRLEELHSGLEMTPPVYVTFTKTDLLAGFEDFFGDLEVEGRRAVLGHTFEPEAPPPSAGDFAQAFDGVALALESRRSGRLNQIRDPRRKALALGFPVQFLEVRDRLVRLLEGAFPSASKTAAAQLRGFYFASGVQQGAPIDALLGAVAQVYDAPPTAAEGAGRAYFINRLLTEVILGEAGLARMTPEARRKRRLMLGGALAGLAGVTVLILALWSISFVANRHLQSRVLAGANNIAQQIRQDGIDMREVRATDPDLEAALSSLRALRDLPTGYGERLKGGPPLYMRFGLFQSSLSRAAQDTYQAALQRILLPRLLLRLEAYQKENAADALALYEPLKSYLMLGGYHVPLDTKGVRAWTIADWQNVTLAGADREDTRKQLGQHLDALLNDKALGRVWGARTAPLDASVIETSRAQVGALSMADRAYALLRQKASGSNGGDWTAAQTLSTGAAQAFADPEAVKGLRVPYFFTKTGFAKAYQLGVQTVQKDLEADLWVLGEDQDKAATRAQMQGLKAGVANRYASDYIAAWQGVARALTPGDYFANPTAASALLSQPSPLRQILSEVRSQTTFAGGTAVDAAGKATLGKMGAAGQVMNRFGPDNPDAGHQIELAFQQLATYVGDGKSVAPIDDFLAKLKAALDAKAFLDRASGPSADQARIAADQAMAALQGAAQMAPGDLQAFVAQSSAQGDRARVASATGAVGRDYEGGLKADCVSITEGRYPFVRNAMADAPVGDVLRLFGPGAPFDSFRTRLQSYLETTGVKWRWRLDDPIAAAFDPTSPEQFQRAAALRDLLTSGVPMQVEATGFGGAVTSAELSLSGSTNRFEPNQAGIRPYQWTPQGLQEAHVTLTLRDRPRTFSYGGPWAAFRLFDAARLENAGPTAFKATFGDGAAYVTFRVTLPTESNPFSRGGPWSFRCPSAL